MSKPKPRHYSAKLSFLGDECLPSLVIIEDAYLGYLTLSYVNIFPSYRIMYIVIFRT